MGIKGLTKLLNEAAPNSYKEQQFKSYFGRKIAIDASMALYQFLIAVRQDGPSGQLTDASGEITSHIIGLFYRSIRMMSNGIKPVFVFDGKPPDLKGDELLKRAEKREKAMEEFKEAEENEDKSKMAQMEKRLVKVSKQHCNDAKKLLTLMGIPWVQAPGEAEAQCAIMTAGGLVYGTATEDMDALTFGSVRLIRKLTYAEARKEPPLEFELSKVLNELNITMDQFIDLCILCGCDYIPSIRGIGPKTAFKLIKQHKTIEKIVKAIDTKKNPVPDEFFFERARKLFTEPEATPCKDIKLEWKNPDEKGLIQFLVDEKGFNIDRVKNGIEKLKASKGKSAQKRLDTFFSAAPMLSSAAPSNNNKDKGKTPKNNKKTVTTKGGGNSTVKNVGSVVGKKRKQESKDKEDGPGNKKKQKTGKESVKKTMQSKSKTKTPAKTNTNTQKNDSKNETKLKEKTQNDESSDNNNNNNNKNDIENMEIDENDDIITKNDNNNNESNKNENSNSDGSNDKDGKDVSNDKDDNNNNAENNQSNDIENEKSQPKNEKIEVCDDSNDNKIDKENQKNESNNKLNENQKNNDDHSEKKEGSMNDEIVGENLQKQTKNMTI